MKVWAIVYGDYYPREIYGLYLTKELAKKVFENLTNDMWEVEEMDVHETVEKEGED